MLIFFKTKFLFILTKKKSQMTGKSKKRKTKKCRFIISIIFSWIHLRNIGIGKETGKKKKNKVLIFFLHFNVKFGKVRYF